MGSRSGRRPQPVHLVFYDDQSRASQAWENALRLLRQDRVDALFGPYSSGLTMTVAEVAREHRKVLWNHGGSSDEILTRGWRHLVSTPTPASDYLRDLPRRLARQAPAPRKICILHSTRGTFASHVAWGVAQAATAEYSVQLTSYSALDVDVLVGELRASRPEILVLAGDFEQEIQIMLARQRLPASIQTVAAVAAGIHAFRDELGGAAVRVIGPSQWEADAGHLVDIEPDAVWFVRHFREQFGRQPEYTAAGGFAVGLIFEECVRHAGSLQDSDLLAAAAELDYFTLYGRFRLDPASGRQVGHRILLVQWDQDHKVVLAATEPPIKLFISSANYALCIDECLLTWPEAPSSPIFVIRDHHSPGASVRLQEVGHHLAGCDEAETAYPSGSSCVGTDCSARKQPGESILTPQSDSPRYLLGTL